MMDCLIAFVIFSPVVLFIGAALLHILNEGHDYD